MKKNQTRELSDLSFAFWCDSLKFRADIFITSFSLCSFHLPVLVVTQGELKEVSEFSSLFRVLGGQLIYSQVRLPF